MQIRDLFATSIQKRIEPVVKVIDRQPEVVFNELNSLVVTPQWERYLRVFLDSYVDAADRHDEQGIGLWVSGFFGSGKSLMVKVLGVLLEGHDVLGQSVHDLFLSRLPHHSPDRAEIARHLAIIKRKLTTTVSGGNLHALQSTSDDSLALITFRLFAKQRGFTQNWPFAWAIEYQIDERGKTGDFRQRASDLSGMDWDEIAVDPEFYLENLYVAAADVLPDNFPEAAAVDRAVTMTMTSGITPVALLERLRRWCTARDGGGRRHKLLIQLDELGQWMQGGSRTERAQQVQALIETAATSGGGRIWIAVTAHGDVQELRSSLQQEEYAKINQRFANKCKLSNEDISKVVEERLLRKNQNGRSALERHFAERSGDLADMGTVHGKRVYPAPNTESFPLFYPYLPWTVAIIPDVVKGIAQAAGRDEALTGSNRTMIGVVQGAVIETPGLLEAPIGRLIALADLYDQISSDAPIEAKTDLNRIRDTVPDAGEFTPRVARALYLLTEAEYVLPTLEHLTRALVDAIDADLSALRAKVATDLTRLVQAGYAKHVGEEYSFLSTQQRSFQERVRARQEPIEFQTYELSQALKEFESDEALRFDRVSVHGRELALKLEIDGRIARNPAAHVVLRVSSSFQKAIDTQIGDDATMKQRSNEDPNAILIRLDDVQGFRGALALAMATDAVANEVLTSPMSSDLDKDIARQARQQDLPSYKTEVRRMLNQAVRGATVFFRGSPYQLMPGESAGAAMRATLGQILPQIYARLTDVPHTIADEASVIRAALANNTTHPDLQRLGVYRADGTLNDTHPLISTLRAHLPIDDQYQQFVQADALRTEIERPPFGWDSHLAQIGLALLLRVSACRLIDAQRTLTDPGDPDVLQVLTKETKFKALRVQGVKADLSMGELQQIRNSIEALFGIKPKLVPATLNSELGDQLAELTRKAQDIQNWANTARCPLPTAFESGASLVTELLNNANPAARLPRFREQSETLMHFNDVLRRALDFRRENGQEYIELQEFFTSMMFAESNLEEVRRFISDWRAVTNERSITESVRWSELVHSYNAAQYAITQQIHRWRQTAHERLAAIEQTLEERVQAANVPEDKITAELTLLDGLFDNVRGRLQQTDIPFNEARGIRTALSDAETKLQQRLRELRDTYTFTTASAREVRLRLSDLTSGRRIASEADLHALIVDLRERLIRELDVGNVITLE
ncbi:MAG: BREX system P-loop protein BrxC [Chloroflexales bacterium]|nr:BREX system P-loop protein BrxC [Chloroflexales bacterium]